jgi:hypothetical protein
LRSIETAYLNNAQPDGRIAHLLTINPTSKIQNQKSISAVYRNNFSVFIRLSAISECSNIDLYKAPFTFLKSQR